MSNEIPQEHIFTMQYYPTDFFYSTNADDMPSGFEGCTIINTSNIKCSSMNNKDSTMTPGNIQKCYQSELCKNKTLVDQLFTIRNQHYASEQRYENVKTKQYFEVVKTANLILGIVGAILFIQYNKGSS